MKPELRHSLHRIRRLRNKKHVLLRAYDRSQSLAKDRMILYAEDANWLCVDQGGNLIPANCSPVIALKAKDLMWPSKSRDGAVDRWRLRQSSPTAPMTNAGDVHCL
jgi:hypothetical protein